MDLDGLGIQLKTFLLIGQELLNIFPLVSLQLNHLAHLSVVDDGAIASWCDVSFCSWHGVLWWDANVDDIPNFFLITFKIFF